MEKRKLFKKKLLFYNPKKKNKKQKNKTKTKQKQKQNKQTNIFFQKNKYLLYIDTFFEEEREDVNFKPKYLLPYLHFF